MQPIICCACGVRFGLDPGVYDIWCNSRRQQFFCPNGHKLSFTGVREQENIEPLKQEIIVLKNELQKSNERIVETEAIIVELKEELSTLKY